MKQLRHIFSRNHYDQIESLQAENLQLKVDLSHANAQIANMEEKLEKKRDAQQIMRKTIQDLKRTAQKSKQPMDALVERGIPADVDVLRAKKVVLSLFLRYPKIYVWTYLFNLKRNVRHPVP